MVSAGLQVCRRHKQILQADRRTASEVDRRRARDNRERRWRIIESTAVKPVLYLPYSPLHQRRDKGAAPDADSTNALIKLVRAAPS